MILLALCSELSWPFDVAPNAHNIGLLAIQTSTPRNPDGVLPPLKTPATDFNPYIQASAADEQPQVWHYQRNEAAEDNHQPEANPNQFTPQPHGWSDEHNEQNYLPEDTVVPADLDRDEDDKTQYLYVDNEGYEQFAKAVGYGVDAQSRYPEGQSVVDQAQAQPIYNGSIEHELQDQMFEFMQPQQNEYGQMFSSRHWNRQMYELQCEDVTDAGQLEMADSRNYYPNNMQSHHPYTDKHRGMNTAVEPQWSAAATFPQLVSNAAQPDYVSVAMPAAIENNMLSTWPVTHVKAAAPSREAFIQSSMDEGDGDFGGYRVQYKQQGMDQFHAVTAAGDGRQKLTAKHTDSQAAAAAMPVPERFQQAFLQPGKLKFQSLSQVCYYLFHFVLEFVAFLLIFGEDVIFLVLDTANHIVIVIVVLNM